MNIEKYVWLLLALVPFVLGIAAAYGLSRYAMWERWCLGRALHEYRAGRRSIESLSCYGEDLLKRVLKYGLVLVVALFVINVFGHESGEGFVRGLTLSIVIGTCAHVTHFCYRMLR